MRDALRSVCKALDVYDLQWWAYETAITHILQHRSDVVSDSAQVLRVFRGVRSHRWLHCIPQRGFSSALALKVPSAHMRALRLGHDVPQDTRMWLADPTRGPCDRYPRDDDPDTASARLRTVQAYNHTPIHSDSSTLTQECHNSWRGFDSTSLR
jgi:hypothetical protein